MFTSLRSKSAFGLTRTNLFSFSKAVVAQPAPAFKAMAYEKGGFKEVSLDSYKGKYVVLFFYPLDFTFVCPTEILDFANKAKDFRNIGAEVVGVSVDSHFTHMAWCNTPKNKGGLGEIDIPLVGDLDKSISDDYGVLIKDTAPAGVAFRGTFIIDGNGTLRHSSVNDLPVGRNVDEVFRLVEAF